MSTTYTTNAKLQKPAASDRGGPGLEVAAVKADD